MRESAKRTQTEVSQTGSNERQPASAYQNSAQKDVKKPGVLYHKVRKPGERVAVTEHSAESPKQEKRKHINSLNSANFVLPNTTNSNSLLMDSSKSKNKQTSSDQKQGSIIITQSSAAEAKRNTVYGLSGSKHVISQKSQEQSKPALAQPQQNFTAVHNIMIKPKQLQPQTQVTDTSEAVQVTEVNA